MPIDASIPLQGKRPDMTGRISDLLGIERQQAELQQVKQTGRQRKALAEFDYSSLAGDDGTIDLNKVMDSGLQKAAGDDFPDVLQKLIVAKQSQVAAKQAVANLRDDQRAAFGTMLGALRSDADVAKDTPEGRTKVREAMGQFAEMYGADVAPVVNAYAKIPDAAPPGKLEKALQNVQLQATSADSQATRQTPTPGYVSTGARDMLVQTNPMAPGGAQMPAQVTKEFGPQLTTNAAGQVVRPDARTGDVAPVQGANPTAAEAAVQGANAPRMQQNITEATAVPQVRNVLQNIIKLSDEVTTGPKSEQLNRIKAMVGNTIPGASSWGDSASAYQEMTKYMEQLALRSWASAGGSGSNAQLEAQIRANPNNEYNSKTVKELAKWVLAGEEAKLAKTKAMMTWLQQPGNSVNNAEQFEIAWADAMDPRVFQAAGMSKEELQKKFSKDERAQIKRSWDKLKSLGVSGL